MERLRGLPLVDVLKRHWLVMKMCSTVLTDPDEYCLMDDDIFMVGSCQDALEALTDHDLVYAPDADYTDQYQDIWGSAFPQQRRLPRAVSCRPVLDSSATVTTRAGHDDAERSTRPA